MIFVYVFHLFCDSNAKSRTPRNVYIPVEERLLGVPLMKHEVEFLLHESAEWGRMVGVRSTEPSGIYFWRLYLNKKKRTISAGDRDFGEIAADPAPAGQLICPHKEKWSGPA